jgi:RNA polymerase sigma-70 factor (ECF subfamily)
VTPDGSAADQELWQRAAAGDGDAFAEVYRRHTDRIYGYCFRRTASWSTAQDLTSLVFLEAWRRRGEVSFDTDGSVIAWLFGVANNVVRNSQRAMRRHQLALHRLPPPDSEPDFADEVDARLDDQRRMAGVLAALASLTDSDREVLALSAWSGLDQRQMADALGVPVGTVKSRLSRARERLRALSGDTDTDANAHKLPTTASREAPR